MITVTPFKHLGRFRNQSPNAPHHLTIRQG